MVILPLEEECGWFDEICEGKKSLIGAAYKALTSALGDTLTTLGTFWVKVPTPDVTGKGSIVYHASASSCPGGFRLPDRCWYPASPGP